MITIDAYARDSYRITDEMMKAREGRVDRLHPEGFFQLAKYAEHSR